METAKELETSSLETSFDSVPEGAKVPFLVGYRKFTLAFAWFILALFVVIMSMFGLSPQRAGIDTITIWVVGTAGFFSAFFVGGNVLVNKWTDFYKHQSGSTLTQQSTTKYVSYDSNEDAAWKEAEKELKKE